MHYRFRKIKEHKGGGKRSKKPSTWHCQDEFGHDGLHTLSRPKHQSPWGTWED